MNIRTFIAVLLTAIISVTGAAQAFDLKQGSGAKLKVTRIQMGIKSPKTNTCPAKGVLKVWVFANKVGNVPVYIAKAGASGVSGPHIVKVKKTGNGIYMGAYTKILKIHQPISAQYRASAPKYKKLSNWVPLKASCKIKLGGKGVLKQ